ncbi:hypothetical protein GGR51DRAFT_531421 [Nemania sp. FL0031]|nr:hypothetical protein GGR51DRAFT_531421 [Nemania sp. FL0031]
MSCPSCGTALPPPPSAMSRMHDTSASSYHITLPTWLNQLDQAIAAAWPTRFVRYSQAAVLMISWEETYAGTLEVEFRRLASVFRTVYGYSVTTWHIPSKKAVHTTLTKTLKLMDDYGSPDNLVIVYYVGHARHNPNGGQFPIWQPRLEPEKGKQLDTAGLHSVLVAAEDDFTRRPITIRLLLRPIIT